MSEEEMKALVEMKDMLKYENEKLKQEKKELIKWLKEERVVDKEKDMKIARDEKNKQFIYGMLIAYKSVLEKLGE